MSFAPASGVVFDIQGYAVHDGPGIRSLVFLKGCPLRCRWCCNPESWKSSPELRHRAARCTGCGSCAAACPHGAVSMIAGPTYATGIADTLTGATDASGADAAVSSDTDVADAAGTADTVTETSPHASGLRPVFLRSVCADCPGRECIRACPAGALSVWGRTMTAAEVVARVSADKDFYRNSGGGVTFSGGEPLAQPAFLKAVLEGCRAEGIHCAVSTCGAVPRADLAAVEALVDLFLFDIKAMEGDLHRLLTGRDNAEILGNLAWLASPQGAARAGDIVVRMPLVPGANDSGANLAATRDFLESLGLSRFVQLPYHELGLSKYAELGLPVLDPRPSMAENP